MVKDFDLVHIEVVEERTINESNELVRVKGSNIEEIGVDKVVTEQGNIVRNEICSDDEISHIDSNDYSEASHGRRRKAKIIKFDPDRNEFYFETRIKF